VLKARGEAAPTILMLFHLVRCGAPFFVAEILIA